MKIDEACVSCIINQSVKVANAINANKTLSHELTSTVEELSKKFSRENTPPEIAAYVYERMAQVANKKDLYAEVKEHSTQKAKSFLPFLYEKLKTTSTPLYTATKIAVAGNVIDLAAEVEFDLEEELEKIFEREFAHNDFALFEERLKSAKNIVVLGDNAGEHIFDYLFIETLQKLYPEGEYYYFVRGMPIINDVTFKEAKEAGFDTLCHLIDSGVDTPGFAYTRATHEAKNFFDEADLVISKGMGNYESLTPSHRDNIFFLLKVKCNVVANSLGKSVGDIICKLQ
ncbi:MAG: DUF89 family protein [Campylobacterales bacterium]|nr:DUF89 family protein [Campylobacterales bacterium]